MGLIIKDKIQKLIVGYPTVSDKYDVQGGLLSGSTNAKFGDLLVFDSAQGTYKVPSSITAVSEIAGFAVAQNVKLATVYPATDASVVFKPNEAINLLVKGYIAVELDSNVTVANVVEGAKVAITLATCALTVAASESSTVKWIPDAYYTGVVENQGTVAAPKYVAEIEFRVK